MNFVIDNWHLAVVTIVGGFIIGLCFRRFWQAVEALMAFEYREKQCREQAKQIKIEFDRVMGMARDTDTLDQLRKRLAELGYEFEKLRRECGK